MPWRQNVRLDPPVWRGPLAAEGRYLVHAARRQPVRPRHARPHGQSVLAERRGYDAAARHVVAAVAGREHQQMFRVLIDKTNKTKKCKEMKKKKKM